MLRKIAQDIWVTEKPFQYLGLEVGTRMTVIRLSNGELVVISPIEVDSTTVEQINDIGNVQLIIAPNLYHHLFVAKFQSIYPTAKLYVAPELENKRSDLAIDKVLDDHQGTIENEIDYLLFEGYKTFDFKKVSVLNELVFFHHQSQTLILTDTAFYVDQSFAWEIQLVAKVIGGYQKLRPTPLEKLATQEKDKVKQSVQKILDWDFKRVIVAHGSIVEKEAKQKFKEGYEWFLSAKLSNDQKL